MDKNIASKVLYIGIDHKNPVGGIASVEHEYSKFIEPFKFVRTCVNGGKLKKALVACEGLAKFTGKMLFDREIKIVHVHAASDASFWRKRIFIRMAKLFGKKVVYHNHGGGFKRFYAGHPAAVMETLALADCVVALSQEWKEFFIKELKCREVRIINNVVSPPCKQQGNHTQNACECFHLTFLGKITKEKGIYDLLDIIEEHKDRYLGKLKLTVGGNGEVERFCKIVEDRGLGGIVEYAGWISGKEKARLLQETDTYILPSYYEGVPISILEAMSYRKPVISTVIGGIPAIVTDGESGILTAPGDKKSIAAAIDTLLENPTLRNMMGEKAYDKVKEFFPAEVDHSLSSLYNSLLENRQ